MLSGRMAARTAADYLKGLTPGLQAYDAQVASEFYQEFRAAARMAWALYTFPRLVHKALSRRPVAFHLYADILKGRTPSKSLEATMGNRLQSFTARATGNRAASPFSG